MRIDSVYIDGFKNLKDVSVDFDESRLTTVIIGENGAGKSNLIEAMASVFRSVDLNRDWPRFTYDIKYQIRNHEVHLNNRVGEPVVLIDGTQISRAAFERDKSNHFPDLVFGYYSGGSRRLERLFDTHQRLYYDTIKRNDNFEQCTRAFLDRRLFYCRPIHGVLSLLSFFCHPNEDVAQLLQDKLGVTGFHSGLALFRNPDWIPSKEKSKRARLANASDVWGALGPAGAGARALRDYAFHPVVLSDRPIDDYREKGGEEIQFACFLRNLEALQKATSNAKTMSLGEPDQDFFGTLEAIDISDLFREFYVWVTREEDDSGDVNFSNLSDGERQLLMVLGLIRLSRGREALFLLDEPDTHLNPMWQHNYLDLIKEWTGVAAEPNQCQIIMNSHNPLTISALSKEEVRVMRSEENGVVTVEEPRIDPRGLGFAGILTDVFGMSSSIDRPTQELMDRRNSLAAKESIDDDEREELDKLNNELGRLGFTYPDGDKLFSLFLRKLDEIELADVDVLSADELEQREQTTKEIVEELLSKK